jgi:hypothetical protein
MIMVFDGERGERAELGAELARLVTGEGGASRVPVCGYYPPT